MANAAQRLVDTLTTPPCPASRTVRLSAYIHTNSVTNMNARNNDFWDTIWDIK